MYRKQYREGRRVRAEKARVIRHGSVSAYRTHGCVVDKVEWAREILTRYGDTPFA